MRKYLILMLCLAGLSGLGACNTVEGFGEDLKALGGKMSDKAKEEKND